MSLSVRYRQQVRVSKPEGTKIVTADFVHTAFEPGFMSGVVDGCPMKWHRDAVVKTFKVTREVDLDGHVVDEKIEDA